MNEYEIGKDVQRLQQRIEALEAQSGKETCCCDREVAMLPVTEEVKVDKDVGGQVASKSWRFGVDRLGNCELRDGASLTLFSDGRYRAIGSRKCNAGGINSCKKHEICVAFFRDGDGQCRGAIQVARVVVAEGLLGPGSEAAFQRDGSDAVLRDLYDRIRCASFWVCRCQTGV